MKFETPGFEIVEQSSLLKESSFLDELITKEEEIDKLYKHIELAGRTCYKSYDKITPTSSKEFVERMIKSGHGGVLEHGTVYLTVLYQRDQRPYVGDYKNNPYSRVNILVEDNNVNIEYITTNYRVIVENGWLKDLEYITTPTVHHTRRVTVLFHCDRITGESFLRHRTISEDTPDLAIIPLKEDEECMSFARESTRFCNYSKNKFDSNITYIVPPWMNKYKCEMMYEHYLQTGEEFFLNHELKSEYDETRQYANYIYALAVAERCYMTALQGGWKPEQARVLLNFSIKSPLVMTGYVDNWVHFFKLRDDPHHAHPQAYELAHPLYKEFLLRGYINKE